MKIKFAHLYYDIMNLYGSNGNGQVIKRYLEDQNIDFSLKYYTINDKIPFDEIDFIYIGCGTENGLKMVMNDLYKYKDQIQDYIDANKFIFLNGNSLELLCNKFDDIDALGIINNEVKYEKRQKQEVVLKSAFIDDEIIGFVNNYGVLEKTDKVFLNYGYRHKNVFATYILGPLLVRNPIFTEKLISEFIYSIDSKFTIKKFDNELDKDAYKEFLEL